MPNTIKSVTLGGLLCACFYLVCDSFDEEPRVFADSNAISSSQAEMKTAQCPDAKESSLPLPSSLTADEFHDKLLAFLQNTEYAKLGWCVDKGVRDTGPYVYSEYLGTHPAVRVYYSPQVMKWLVNGRIDAIPDGAMIVKEMYVPAPAARYEGKQLTPESWTVMIKDSKGSKDGWFWGGLWTKNGPMPKPSDSYKPPFGVLNEGFGLTCLHCHASSEKEFTFASTKNIKGFPGNPLSFFIDDTWRDPPPPETKVLGDLAPGHKRFSLKLKLRRTELASQTEFLKFFKEVPIPGGVQVIPAETYDHIVAGPAGAEQFITSDSCMSCHSGNAWFGSKYTMILEGESKNPVNVSPYGEWRWSPMGLAGRDPIFFAQLDSELAYLKDRPDDQQKVINTCFRCHGVMGKRQLDADHGYDPASPNDNVPEPNFKLDWVYNTDLAGKDFKYGALARDGVSCASCHHIVKDKPQGPDPLQSFLEHNITGQFTTGKAGEIFGPFEDKDISPHPMKESLGIEPKYDEYVKNSRLCGNCHTINLPVMDQKPFGHSLEQVTYLEWLNSEFQTDYNPGPNAKSCQDCHMASSYVNAKNNVNIKQILTAFADVQDDTYPAAENIAPFDLIRARFRDKGFVRHQFQGLNVFLLEIFNQFMTSDGSAPTPNYSNDILGVRKSDYMSTLDNDLPNAIANFVQSAQNDTATIAVSQPTFDAQKLSAEVTVTNKVGHRFPSGVGFRRAFIEFDIIDSGAIDPKTKQPKIVWSSGRTNEAGFILDKDGNILESEYIGTNRNKKGPPQPHFWGKDRPITNSTQVQIYEELVKDANGDFTTSFIRRDAIPKDNRLLPRGWTREGPAPKSFKDEFLHSTFAEGEAAKDPSYTNGSGTSIVRYEIPLGQLATGADPSKLTVKATLYYQSIPPYYLTQRFEQAPNAPGTQRLYYLTSRLNTRGTPIEGWRLLIASSPAVAVLRVPR
jgi:mono/diheme cytochrome c family protein